MIIISTITKNIKIKNIVIITFVVISCLSVSIFSKVTASSSFENTYEPGIPTLIDFGSSTCEPCQRLQEVLEVLVDEYSDVINFQYYDIYKSDEAYALSRTYSVRALPTLIFLDEYGKEVHREVGYKTVEELEYVFISLGWIQ